MKLFADDELLYRILAKDANCDQRQKDLHKLEEWQHRWQMEFKPSKCKILCISTKQNPSKSKYTFFVTKLNQVESISYLVVPAYCFNLNKCYKTLGLIRRNLWNCLKNVTESPYRSIVGPKLEYASASWDPHYKKAVHTLERVQRKAARLCLQNFNRTASVTEMLGELEWDTE